MARNARPITVDLEELGWAMEDHGESIWYLDTETGDVFFVSDDAGIDELPVSRDELDGSARFEVIEPLDSHESREEMRAFAAGVKDARIRELLEVAVAGQGAFSRFKAVLAAHPAVRERWFIEHNARVEEQARGWLDELDLAWSPRRSGPEPKGGGQGGGRAKRR
ncbi:MAG: UPF0158 family protein [Anaeromyxobacter sp.]